MPLSNHDIPGSTDPLDPQYITPALALRPVTPPRFLRDTLDVADIAGDPSTRRKPWQTAAPRPSMDWADVPCSTAITSTQARESRRRKTPSAALETLDINHPPDLERQQDRIRFSNRQTNTLSPRYRYDVPADPAARAVFGSGPHPRVTAILFPACAASDTALPTLQDQPSLSLSSTDVPGAQSRSQIDAPSLPFARRQVRNPTHIGDIERSSPGARKAFKQPSN
eukprot:gene12334-2250_t